MLALDLPKNGAGPATILCLGSHSDDIEIGCGGTILRLIAEHPALNIVWIVFSSDKQREKEARKSAQLFLRNAQRSTVIVKQFRDGFFPFDGPKIKRFFEGLKKISPDVIFTHNQRDAHQDHRLIAELSWNTFRNHLILEYEIPKYDGDLGQPNLFVPLEKKTYGKKIRYITEVFQTQRKKHWFKKEMFEALLRLRGMECVAPSGYAEAFFCRKLVL
jgi:LmbE family N-acetylglucosaminyl deacetylase